MINIVLFEPEIPQNTGNIMRTCVASGCVLHLIKPYGFLLDEKHLRRSGMDYINDLTYFEYNNIQEFYEKNTIDKIFYITRYGEKTYTEVNYLIEDNQNLFLMFGKESTGIDKNILKNNLDLCLRIPMVKKARSLNLSNCVALVTYEALRQNDFFDLSRFETIKGKDFLEKYEE